MSEIIIDELTFSDTDIIEVLRSTGQIPVMVRELFLENVLKEIELEPELEDKLVADFRKQRDLQTEEAYVEFLDSAHLNERLLKKMLTRPERIIKYREERWGPRAQSLYLKHKERYDKITYQRLQCKEPGVMQEVFFRIQDGEETWDSLSKQFYPQEPNASARIESVPVNTIENILLEELRKAGEGKIIKPLIIGDQVVVAELEAFEPSKFDDNLRQIILRDQFEGWLSDSCTKMLKKTSFAS